MPDWTPLAIIAVFAAYAVVLGVRAAVRRRR
jgi:hypothetical protein